MPFLGILFILELFIWHIFGKDCRLWKPQMCHYDDFINYRKYARKTTIHTYLFSTISVMWVQESATDPIFVCTDFPVNSFLSYKHNARKDVCMTQKSVQTNRFNMNIFSNQCNEKMQYYKHQTHDKYKLERKYQGCYVTFAIMLNQVQMNQPITYV